MREVANRLERMGCINRDIRLAIAMVGPQCDRLLALRADFSFECNQLLNQLTAKLASSEHARTASRILDAFVGMQQILTSHQARWTMEQVAFTPEGFMASSRDVHAAIINFLEDALDIIDAASIRLGRRQRDAKLIAPDEPVRLTGTR